MLVVETGKISLVSKLAGYNPEVDYKTLKNVTSLYDQY